MAKAAPKGINEVPVEKTVDDYSERPYSEAVSEAHLAYLKANGNEPAAENATAEQADPDA